MSASSKKYNVCGILISVHAKDQCELLKFLSSIESCEVLETTAVQVAAIVEDSSERSAYATMECIKEHPSVLSMTLVNHYFEEL